MELPDKPSTIHNYQKLILSGCLLLTGLMLYLYMLYAVQRPHSFTATRLEIRYGLPEKITGPTHINRDHDFCGYCSHEKQASHAWQLGDYVALLSPKNAFLVNIGVTSSSDGKYDLTYPLLTSNNPSFDVLLIDAKTRTDLLDAYPKRPNIHIINDYIWPETAVENIFVKYNVPKQFTLLKVNIHSYECSLIEKILSSNYRPQIIHTEFNPVFPPPIVFMTVYNETTKDEWQPPIWSLPNLFYGCSLTALSNIMKLYDYVLVEVDFRNAIYIERHFAAMYHIPVPANDKIVYEHGFLNHSCFSHCQGNTKLYDSHIDQSIKLALIQLNFTEFMRNKLDYFVPVSTKTNNRHPYIIRL